MTTKTTSLTLFTVFCMASFLLVGCEKSNDHPSPKDAETSAAVAAPVSRKAEPATASPSNQDDDSQSSTPTKHSTSFETPPKMTLLDQGGSPTYFTPNENATTAPSPDELPFIGTKIAYNTDRNPVYKITISKDGKMQVSYIHMGTDPDDVGNSISWSGYYQQRFLVQMPTSLLQFDDGELQEFIRVNSKNYLMHYTLAD